MPVVIRIQIATDAPPAPPCFQTRDIWLGYVESCSGTKLTEHGSQPYLASPQGGLVWNPEFSPCEDCLQEHEAAMVAAGRCQRGAFSWTPEPEPTPATKPARKPQFA